MEPHDKMDLADQSNKSLKGFNHRIDGFSKKHNFSTKLVRRIILGGLLLVIILSILGIYSLTTITRRTIDFRLKDIGELATQAGYFKSVQIISGVRQLFGVEIPLTRNKFIYSYDGVIKAGIDFEAVEVKADEQARTVRVKLPEAKVLSIEVDENSFEVFDETNNIFNPIKISNMNVSLIELKEQVRETALKNGLLENTRKNAETLITGFLAGVYGTKEYSIIFE